MCEQGRPQSETRELDLWHMADALKLAKLGEGRVEPNPMVGCVIARGAEPIAEGYHQRFGGPHAEIEALRIAGDRARGSTIYVTLEPCCHTGKTPPCTEALIAARPARVVVALRDPFPKVAGGGISALQKAGIDVNVGVREDEARKLCAPYLKLVETGRPWVIAKWAMTLDGRIATCTGSSRWITGPAARLVVHMLRARCDAILIGSGTALADDPLLNVRLGDFESAESDDETPHVRHLTRIVFDTRCRLSADSRLAQTAKEHPTMVVVGSEAPADRVDALKALGVEILSFGDASRRERIDLLLDELGQRRMTNLLVEGGSHLLGSLFKAGAIDEFHAFIAPKLVGGRDAPGPIGDEGIEQMADALTLANPTVEQLGPDLYIHGRR